MEKVTLAEWLSTKTCESANIALRDKNATWDIWELLYFVNKASAIPHFPYGQMLKNLCVYTEGRWVFSEEDGSRLYEMVVKV